MDNASHIVTLDEQSKNDLAFRTAQHLQRSSRLRILAEQIPHDLVDLFLEMQWTFAMAYDQSDNDDCVNVHPFIWTQDRTQLTTTQFPHECSRSEGTKKAEAEGVNTVFLIPI